jgi:hypothetical protein
MRVARYEADCSHYLVWIAKPFNTNVLQHFHQEIMTTYITYSIANDYYMHYLQRNQEPIEDPWKTLKTVDFILKTENRKLKTENLMTTSSSQIQQVMPFSLFHYASNAPQTKKRQAFSVILTHSNKTEMPYQVMRDIPGMDIPIYSFPHPPNTPMPQCPNAPMPQCPYTPHRPIDQHYALVFS